MKWISILLISSAITVVRGIEDTELCTALNNGADAKLFLCIMDQDSKPVQNAHVNAIFLCGHSNGGYQEVNANTDADGICVVKGKCTGVLKWMVSKEGYYNSSGKWNLFATLDKNKVRKGKWQPYGERKTILINKVKRPDCLQIPNLDRGRLAIPEFNKWLAIDFGAMDWLPPFGCGKFSDAMVFCRKEIKKRRSDFEFEMIVSFTNNPYAGCYRGIKDRFSDFPWVHEVNTNEVFSSIYCYRLRRRNGGGVENNEITDNEYLIFRTRTTTNETGCLKTAHYGVISGPFRMGRGNIYIGDACFNPVPNDTNIEDGYYLRKRVREREKWQKEEK